jgi:hypothetical protein
MPGLRKKDAIIITELDSWVRWINSIFTTSSSCLQAMVWGPVAFATFM